MGGTGGNPIPSSFPAGVTPPPMGANTTPSAPKGFTLPTAGTNMSEWMATQWAGLSPADQAKLQTSPPPTASRRQALCLGLRLRLSRIWVFRRRRRLRRLVFRRRHQVLWRAAGWSTATHRRPG